MSGLRLIYLAAALGAFWLAAPGWGLGRWALGPETLAALAAALWVGAEVMVRRNWIWVGYRSSASPRIPAAFATSVLGQSMG